MTGRKTFFTPYALYLAMIFFGVYMGSVDACANGGGVYTNSAVIRSADPVFRTIHDVQLISEKLFIRPVGGRCEVTVKYVLHNASDNDYLDLDYAFPVDRIDSFDLFQEPPVQSIEFRMNGERLSYTESADTFFQDANFLQSNNPNLLLSSEGRHYLYRRWYYSKISIPRNSWIELVVSYLTGTLNRCDGNSPMLIDYNFTGCTMRYLYYDFSPASSWGDGIVRDFYVEIDGTDLALTGEPYRKFLQDETDLNDELIKVEGLDFETVGNKHFYRERNFDLKKASPLFLSYQTSLKTSIDIIARRRIPNHAYRVIVSSEKDKYPATHLTDMNLETAWVPKKSKGERVEFVFNQPIDHVSGFSLLNGYHKNADTYQKNNRIKVLKVEIKHAGDNDWREMAWQDEFEDKLYYPAYFSDLFYHAELVDFFDLIDELKKIERIRLTIEDVYPGSTYDDTCISEIILYTWSFFNGYTDNEFY